MAISTWKSPSVGSCVHIRVVVFVGYAECAPSSIFIPPHSLLAFPLAALQSTLVVLESRAQHLLSRVCCLDCNRILYLASAYLIDSGNIHRGRRCSSIGTCQLFNCWVIYSRSYEEDIPHKLKLITRQYEIYCIAAVKGIQSYTSVELTIIQLDRTACPSARSCRWPICHSGRTCTQECWTSTPTSDYDHPNLFVNQLDTNQDRDKVQTNISRPSLLNCVCSTWAGYHDSHPVMIDRMSLFVVDVKDHGVR